MGIKCTGSVPQDSFLCNVNCVPWTGTADSLVHFTGGQIFTAPRLDWKTQLQASDIIWRKAEAR